MFGYHESVSLLGAKKIDFNETFLSIKKNFSITDGTAELPMSSTSVFKLV
jgi:hypothetical protein